MGKGDINLYEKNFAYGSSYSFLQLSQCKVAYVTF